MPDFPDPLIEAITANVAEAHPEVTTEMVSAVLDQITAAQELVSGDALDTIRRNDAGDLAVRVLHNGVPGWRIQPGNGDPVYFDLAPTLEWPVLYSPSP